MARPEIGDWIAIRDCGAYTLSMWSHHCNRGIPAVLGYDGESIRTLRNADTPHDAVRQWSIERTTPFSSSSNDLG